MSFSSSLVRCSGGLMEAIWLAAMVCTPLFFNVRGETVEAEKNFLLRSLAIILVASVVMHVLLGQTRSGPDLWKRLRSYFKSPTAIVAALLALIVLISTALSLTPSVSFWGASGRRVGSNTYLSCLLFFFVVSSALIHEKQIHRIITIAILTSLPVSLYGIGQRFSIDPIIWAGGPTIDRVGSTFAHAIYLGAYLIMVLPLTVSRIFIHFQAAKTEKSNRSSSFVLAGIYTSIAIAQVAAIFCTVSRGPVVGAAGGATVMFLLLAIYWRKRALVTGTMGAGFLVLAGLAFLSWQSGPFQSFHDRYELQRFSELLNPQVGTGAERAAAWKVAAQAARFSAEIELANGQQDPWAPVRSLIGYGPDTIGPVGRLYSLSDFNAVLPDHILFDRFHSNFWDTLITTGFPGLLVTFLFAFLVIQNACHALGLGVSPLEKKLLWTLFMGGGLLGSLLFILWQGAGFAGAGLRFGSLTGLGGFLLRIAWTSSPNTILINIPAKRALTIIALLAAIVAHLIEIEFSFFIETTLLHFFVYSGLLLVLSRMQTSAEPVLLLDTDNARTRQGSALDRRIEISGGLILGLVLVQIGFMLIQKTEPHDTMKTLVNALTRLPGYSDSSTGFLLATLLLVIGLFGIVWIRESEEAAHLPQSHSLARIALIGGAIALICWLPFSYQIARMMPFTEAGFGNLEQFLGDRLALIDLHYAFTFAVILIMAATLPSLHPDRGAVVTQFSRIQSGAALVALLLAVLIVYTTQMKWSKSGLIEKLCTEPYLQRPEQWPITTEIHQRAIRFLPRADNHYLALGKILQEQVAVAQSPIQHQALFGQTDQLLERAGKLKPLDAVFPVRRGNLYLKRAVASQDPDQKKDFGAKAMAFYVQGAARDPGNPAIWNNMAYLQFIVFNAPNEAHRILRHSIDLHPRSHPAAGLLADVLFHQSVGATNGGHQKMLLNLAAVHYQRAIGLVSTNNLETRYKYLVGLGKSMVKLGNLPAAITNYQDAVTLSPTAERWRNEEMLARLFTDINNKSNAVIHLERALDHAPIDKRPGLLKLRDEIASRP